MKIYTRTGDSGDTGLFGGGRVPKDHPRVAAYGDVDELNAAIGVARAAGPLPRVDEVLVPVQRDLFAIGSLLATPDREKMAPAPREGSDHRSSDRRTGAVY
jgi:cob(I)alamin adenosyltransferase